MHQGGWGQKSKKLGAELTCFKKEKRGVTDDTKDTYDDWHTSSQQRLRGNREESTSLPIVPGVNRESWEGKERK